MATSGAADFNLDLTEIVEDAYERAGGEMRSGYDLRTARRSLNLMFADWANRGVNMWTFEQITQPLTAGIATYNLAADTVDLMEVFLRTGSGTTQTDITLGRISVSSYAAIPNKATTGRPLQVFIERLVTQPRFTVWPTPDAVGTYTVVSWRLRRIQNAGDGTSNMDVPFRFIPAMVAGLAYYLALKVPGGMERLADLKGQYDEAWLTATDEDREKATVRFVPRIAPIRG